MTKKHFIRLAEYLSHYDISFTQEQIEHLAAFCQEQNSNFNKSRWIGYIKGENGPNGGKKVK